jgi:hypothetical protein
MRAGFPKGMQAILSVLTFIVVNSLIYIAYIKFFKIDVLFYSSLYAAMIAVLLSGGILFFFRIFSALTKFEKIQMLSIFILVGYILSISVPTVIDRSLSFYILEKLQQRGGGIRLEKFNYIFTTEYMREHRLIDVRLTEQVNSGTIWIDGNCVRLTNKGDKIASFGRWFRMNLLPKRRLLMNEYTDQLTDPFRRSDEYTDYICK